MGYDYVIKLNLCVHVRLGGGGSEIRNTEGKQVPHQFLGLLPHLLHKGVWGLNKNVIAPLTEIKEVGDWSRDLLFLRILLPLAG